MKIKKKKKKKKKELITFLDMKIIIIKKMIMKTKI